jgi:uroporphyrinogen-III synthase
MALGALEGFVVGVTADRRASEQAELFERRGASVLLGPALSTQYLGNEEALLRATDALIARPPDDVVLTTGIGVRAWFEAAQSWGLADDLLAALTPAAIYARGPKAVAAIQVAGLPTPVSVESERLDDVLARLKANALDGRVIAYQHYGEHNDRATSALTAAGAIVVGVPVYRYGRATDEAPARSLVAATCDGRLDAVTFTSAPAVARFLDIAEADDRRDDVLRAFNQRDVVAGCIGPVCAAAAEELGIAAPAAPEKGRLGLLVRCITDVLQARRRELRLGDLPVVIQGSAVAVGDMTVVLSPGERAVLDALTRRPGAVVSKAALSQVGSAGAPTDHALEAIVGRLRRRLGPAGRAVQAVRGRGYRLDLACARNE